MSSKSLLIIVSILLLAGITALTLKPTSPKAPANSNAAASAQKTYRDETLGLSFSYPSSWQVDESQKDEKTITVLSQPRTTLEAIAATGNLNIFVTTDNPDHLAPTAWFEKNRRDILSETLTRGEQTINGYPAYVITVNELQQRKHVFLFKDDRVVEVAFPTVQPQFTAAYESILASITLL